MIPENIPEKSYRPYGCKVALRNNNGVISLRYTPPSEKQVELSLGLDWYNTDNHHKAKAIAQQIHNDIYIYENYDPSKEKYRIKKSKKIVELKPKEFTLNDCWLFYLDKRVVDSSEQSRFKRINKLFNDCQYSISELPKLAEKMLEKYSKSTVEHDLKKISAVINLAKKYKKHNQENLVSGILESLKDGNKKTIKIFSQDKLKLILEAFKNDTYTNPNSLVKHSYYYPFVAIRALTGMRPSEAIALTWSDIIEKNGKTWLRINKRYSCGELKKGTKNGAETRYFPINNQLKELLNSTPKILNENNLIFPSWKDHSYINAAKFSLNLWLPTINQMCAEGLIPEYLPFYDLRHTFISHMARSGKVDLKTLAAICGNSVETIINNYLAVNEDLELPNLF